MPFYDFRCKQCGKEEEVFMKFEDWKRPLCCGDEMTQVYSHRVNPDLEPYLDPNLGEKPVYVKSKRHRRKLMKEAGVVERYGKGWR